ncbi:MAG TPA: type IV toxin-antitoxin system AbiEi family antitoxin domain-containing protein [Acidimicrobiales bacterium]|nr:type IV toxin-antitoxin system AbiEi family antitoxin domain-containing protein [Acidimicrobiales bacterium]
MLIEVDTGSAVSVVQRSQHGLITRRQAMRAGLTRSTIATNLANGVWVSVRRGVYALAGVRPSRGRRRWQ